MKDGSAISNKGGTESQIEVLESRFRPAFYPEIAETEVNLVSTIQHHLDIAAFQASQVPILVGFHNWGEQPPSLGKLMNFYEASGAKVLDKTKPLNETPLHLADLGSPVVYGETFRMNLQ